MIRREGPCPEPFLIVHSWQSECLQPTETSTEGPGAGGFSVLLGHFHSSADTLGLSRAELSLPWKRLCVCGAKVCEKMIVLTAGTLGLDLRRADSSSLCYVAVLGKLLITFACQFPHSQTELLIRPWNAAGGVRSGLMCKWCVLYKALCYLSLGSYFIPLVAIRQNLVYIKKLILL